MNTVEEMGILWEDIKNHKDSSLFRHKSWVLMGDFDEILESNEHSIFGTPTNIPTGMRDFNQW